MLLRSVWCWLLIHCFQLLWTCQTQEQNEPLSENEKRIVYEFGHQLEAMTVTLLQEKEQEMERNDFGPLPFEMPSHFMHSYRPHTGVGNREALVIDNITEVPLYLLEERPYSKWRYARFNNSDFVLAMDREHVAMWKNAIDLATDTTFLDNSILPFEPSSTGPVLDSIIFIRREQMSSGFFVAILSDENISFVLHIYEVVENRGILVSVIDLSSRTFELVEPARKLAYLSSRYAGSLVVLVSNTDTVGIKYNKEVSNVRNHYIKVLHPNAIDIVTFTVGGYGYIAVANETTCIVYKFNEYGMDHKTFHIMHAQSIVNLEHFRIGFRTYLAITSAQSQSLYIAKRGEFVLAQQFSETGVQQILAVLLADCRDDVVLLFLKEHDHPDALVWNGQLEKFDFHPPVVGQNFQPMPGSITSFSYGRLALLMFKERSHVSRLLVIRTHLDPVPDPVLVIGKEMSDLMQKLQDTINEQDKTLKSMEAVLINAVKADGNHKFTAVQSFSDLISTRGTLANVAVNNNIVWGDSQISLQEYLDGTQDIEARIDKLEEELSKLENILPDIVRVDQDAVIEGSKTFFGEVYGDSLITEYLNVESAGSIDFVKLQQDLYRVDRPSTIRGEIIFEKPLTVTGDLHATFGINGLDFGKDVLTTNGHQISNASMTFQKKLLVEEDLIVSGTVNGIDIGKEAVTLAGNHVVKGQKTFRSGIEAERVTAQHIDGVDLDRLFHETLTISRNQKIRGSKHFTGTIQTNGIELSGTLNGYDIKNLTDDIVRTDVPSTVFGHKTFAEEVIIRNSLAVGGTINGLKIPDDIFLLDKPNTVTAKKEFLGHVKANVVNVHGLVNGLSLPSDIITLSGDEFINNTVYFTDGITVQNDVVVHGLIDGVDIDKLNNEALTLDQLANIDNVVFKGPVTINGNLELLGTVNGISLDIVRDVVYKGETNIVIESEKTFDTVSAGSVRLGGTINNYNLSSDFMTVHGDQFIEGEIVFKKPVTFKNVFVDNEVIGGVNIRQLYDNKDSLSLPDHVLEDIEFMDSLVVDEDLTVNGKFGHLSFPDDFVLKSTDQDIKNKLFSGKVRVEELIVSGDIDVQETFGGVNLREFFDERVTLSTDQVIPSDMTLGDVSAARVSIYGLINGIDIVEFANNVMSLTKDQNITGYKEFKGVTNVVGSVMTRQGVNGIDLADIHRRAFKVSDNNIVTSDVTFHDKVTLENVHIFGRINGVNITQLDRDSVKTEGEQYVTGDTVFHQGFHVEGDIVASRVNDLDLPDDVLTKDTNQDIWGTYILKNVVIDGDFHVKGQVNGMDFDSAASSLTKLDKHNVIESDVQFLSPIDVLNDIHISGLVNGIDLKLLRESSLRATGDQKIPGHKIFKGNVTVFGDVNVTEVNGVLWQRFLNEVVRIDIPKVITGLKVFRDGLEVQGDLSVTGVADIKTINGVDLQSFQNDVVFVDVPANITGTKVFSAPVEITGDLNAELINGFHLKTDVITLQCGDSEPQVITGKKTFQNLVVLGDVNVSGLVNEYNLSELVANTLTIDGDQVITGHKIFNKPVVFLNDLTTSTVNGIVLSEELIPLDTDQDITGSLTFTDNVHVNKDLEVDGLLNGVDIVKLAKDALYVDTDQEIEGSYTIDRAVVNDVVHIDSTVNDIQLAKFEKRVNNFWVERKKDFNRLESEMQEQCHAAQHLHSLLEHSYYVLNGFSLYQTLNVSADHIEVGPTIEDFSLIQIDESTSVCSINHYRWVKNQNAFMDIGRTDTTFQAWKTYHLGEHEIRIQIGIKPKDSIILYDRKEVLQIVGGFTDASAVVFDHFAVMAVLYSTRNICEIYEIQVQDPLFVTPRGNLKIADAKSVAMFEMNNVVYLAVARYIGPDFAKESSEIYAYIQDDWQLVQNAFTSASYKVSHFTYHNYHYLMFTDLAPFYNTKEPQSVQIYRNSDNQGLPFALFQKLPFDGAKNIEIFEFGGLSELFLTVFNDTRVQVFLLEGETGFTSNYVIHGKCITAAKPIVLDTELYLVVSQNDKEQTHRLTSNVYKGITQGTTIAPRKLTYC